MDARKPAGALLLSRSDVERLLTPDACIAAVELRTAAATAVAAKYLAPERCEAALICGCGAQAAAQLRALLQVRRPARVYVYDHDREKARQFASGQETQLPLEVSAVPDLREAAAASRIIVTCT